MQNYTKRKHYTTKSNVTLKNRFSNETMKCDVVDEDEVEGKKFWVVNVANRSDRLKFSKDAWSLVGGR